MTHPIIDFLLKKCHHTIFSRGESYVHNVHYLTKEDDTYTAKVLGSSVYEVEIVDEEDGDFYVSCNCPYESTYCKHVVAVGLQINEGNFKEIEATDEDEDDDEELSPLDGIAPADFYDTIFAKADKKVQEDFLKQFFLQNESFRNQFFNYQLAVNLPIESAKTTAKTSAKTHLNGAVSIDEEIEEVRDALCDLELDYDTFHEENGNEDEEYYYRNSY